MIKRLRFFCINTKYRQDDSIRGRDITVSVLQKQTSTILKFFFWFWLWPHHRVIRTILVFCIKLPNFIYIGPPNAEIWRHIDFSRWRPRRFNTISGFLLLNATVFGRNHMFTISSQPVTRFWFCEGSNFAISHRKAWSPLTRCLQYRAARDKYRNSHCC